MSKHKDSNWLFPNVPLFSQQSAHTLPPSRAGCGPRRTSGRLHACATGGGRAVGYNQCPVTVTAPHTPRVVPSAPAGVRHLDGHAPCIARLPPPPSPAPWAGGLPSSTAASHRGAGGRLRCMDDARAAYATPRAREAPSAAALARGSCVCPPPRPPLKAHRRVGVATAVCARCVQRGRARHRGRCVSPALAPYRAPHLPSHAASRPSPYPSAKARVQFC